MISNEYKLIIDDLRLKSRAAFLHYGKGDFAEAIAVVEDLLERLPAEELSTAAMEVQSCYLEFLLLNLLMARDGDWDCKRVAEFVADLQQPRATVEGEHERVNNLLQIRAIAGFECGNPLRLDEYEELANCGSLKQTSSNFWDAIALWAFRENHLEPLEAAFENQTINPGHSMPQESWQRINLMYQLRRGTASLRDVSEYLALLRMVTQAIEFMRIIKPVAEEQGLWNEELELEYQRRLELARTGSYDFPRERRTGRMRS